VQKETARGWAKKIKKKETEIATEKRVAAPRGLVAHPIWGPHPISNPKPNRVQSRRKVTACKFVLTIR